MTMTTTKMMTTTTINTMAGEGGFLFAVKGFRICWRKAKNLLGRGEGGGGGRGPKAVFFDLNLTFE